MQPATLCGVKVKLHSGEIVIAAVFADELAEVAGESEPVVIGVPEQSGRHRAAIAVDPRSRELGALGVVPPDRRLDEGRVIRNDVVVVITDGRLSTRCRPSGGTDQTEVVGARGDIGLVLLLDEADVGSLAVRTVGSRDRRGAGR